MEIIIAVIVALAIYAKGRADGRKALKKRYDELR